MLTSRRRLIQGLVAGTATASFGAIGWSGTALASDLALSDRIDLLYSNQFNFNERGEPQITVGLMQGQTEVVLSASKGLEVLPSGDGGTSIIGSGRYRITLGKSSAARQTFGIVLEELVGKEALRPQAAVERWKARGFDAADAEVGTVFGVSGHVLDNRRVMLTTGRFTSERVALEHAHQAKREHGAVGKLHPVVHRRSAGALEAVDLETNTRISADGVLWFSPRGNGSITVHDVLSGTTMGKGSRSDRTYWGSVYVAIDRNGKLAVVNLVSESRLLAGLVPAEIFASAPAAALEAQAVAARGQLVAKVGVRHLDDPFLLCAEQHCQVYAGRGREHPRTTKAVHATMGVVAMRPGETKLVDTVYSANSGGHTEHNDKVWPGAADAQLRGRADPLLPKAYQDGITAKNIEAFVRNAPPSHSRPQPSATQAPYRWTATIDPSSLPKSGAAGSIGVLKSLRVTGRGKSGRATDVELVGSKRTIELHGELTIRRALGGLKSSMFVIDAKRDKFGRFVLHGGGHGHGVGLCQHGAMGMARAGKSHQDILAHYYRGAHIVKLWG